MTKFLPTSSWTKKFYMEIHPWKIKYLQNMVLNWPGYWILAEEKFKMKMQRHAMYSCEDKSDGFVSGGGDEALTMP